MGVESSSLTYQFFDNNFGENEIFILEDSNAKYLFTLVKKNKDSIRISLERLQQAKPGSSISFKLPEHCDCKTDIPRENPHYYFTVYKIKEGLYRKKESNVDRKLRLYLNHLEESFIEDFKDQD